VAGVTLQDATGARNPTRIAPLANSNPASPSVYAAYPVTDTSGHERRRTDVRCSGHCRRGDSVPAVELLLAAGTAPMATLEMREST
jgi:hypothetical protein